jgi:hypothetical protein
MSQNIPCLIRKRLPCTAIFRLSFALTAILVVASVTGFFAPAHAGSPASYDSMPWLADLEQAREALATKYANLEWVVLEREVDLESLFTDAKTQLQSATSDNDARAAFDRLARRLGDGHVRFRWSVDQSTPATPIANCAALGYDARIRGGDVAALCRDTRLWPLRAHRNFLPEACKCRVIKSG